MPSVLRYLVNIEKARPPPQHDARSIVEPTEGLGGGSGPTLVRQGADVEYSYSSSSTTSPTFRTPLVVMDGLKFLLVVRQVDRL